MFDNLYKSFFRWSYKKHLAMDQFLIALGLYVQHVQSNNYARKMRTAMLWSATSALYLWWELEVQSPATLKLWNLELGEINQENILLVFFVLTGYYTMRLCFLAVKAFGFVNPFFLILPLYRRKKHHKISKKYSMESIKIFLDDPAELDVQLCCWLDYLRGKFRHALDSTITTRTQTLTVGNPPAKRPTKEQKRKELGYMQCAEQARFMVQNPTLGLLENFFFPVLVIPGGCSFVVYRLAANVFF